MGLREDNQGGSKGTVNERYDTSMKLTYPWSKKEEPKPKQQAIAINAAQGAATLIKNTSTVPVPKITADAPKPKTEISETTQPMPQKNKKSTTQSNVGKNTTSKTNTTTPKTEMHTNPAPENPSNNASTQSSIAQTGIQTALNTVSGNNASTQSSIAQTGIQTALNTVSGNISNAQPLNPPQTNTTAPTTGNEKEGFF